MTLKLAKAFGYDIDFAQDLRDGDSFSVIYDELYREGERLRDGDIIAATFINQGKRYTACRYTNAEGEPLYYTEDGRPLRKAFLRTPVEFTRISLANSQWPHASDPWQDACASRRRLCRTDAARRSTLRATARSATAAGRTVTATS